MRRNHQNKKQAHTPINSLSVCPLTCMFTAIMSASLPLHSSCRLSQVLATITGVKATYKKSLRIMKDEDHDITKRINKFETQSKNNYKNPLSTAFAESLYQWKLCFESVVRTCFCPNLLIHKPMFTPVLIIVIINVAMSSSSSSSSSSLSSVILITDYLVNYFN